MQDENDAPPTELRRALRGFLKPDDHSYAAIRDQLEAAERIFRKEIATIIEPAINREVATMPKADYTDKKVVANWINRELRRFSLALHSNHGNEPCIIQATSSRDHVTGRFRLDYVDSEGRHRTPRSFAVLPPLKVIPDFQPSTPYRTKTARSR